MNFIATQFIIIKTRQRQFTLFNQKKFIEWPNCNNPVFLKIDYVASKFILFVFLRGWEGGYKLEKKDYLLAVHGHEIKKMARIVLE